MLGSEGGSGMQDSCRRDRTAKQKKGLDHSGWFESLSFRRC